MKTQRIIVAAGLCTPARNHVRTALEPYGVQFKATSYWETLDGKLATKADDAAIDICEVIVPDAQARWAEYLLLRSGKLQLASRPIDPRNAQWALRHRGNMPRPWVQAGCTWPSAKKKRSQPWWRRLFSNK